MTALAPAIDDAATRPNPASASAWRVLLEMRTRLEASSARVAFVSVGILAAVIYLWNLTASGFANTYYSAAALAASQSWSAWFFGSLDAGNFITVDKPPLATMLMGLSVRLFGLSSASILLPEALLGVGSVLLLFTVVRRQFGVTAATIAAVLLALTPVAALMFRYDHPDALLTFLMLLAAYGTQRAIENGRQRWLVLAGICLGLAFLTKYFQGFLVGPALALAYVVAANASVRRRVTGLFVLGLTTLAAAGAWVAAVELTPADLRPYIGGSTNNSVLDLIFGYDGLGRIFGGSGSAIGAGQGGANFSGTPGLLRLLNAEFGGQIAWLLPAALIALVAGLVLTRRGPRIDVGRAGYLMWGGWLLVTGIVFSYMSGIVHAYYAVAMAPALAALVGAGVVGLWRARASAGARERVFARATLAAMILVTVATSALLLLRSADFVPWLWPVVLAFGLAAALLVALANSHQARLATAGLALGLVAMVAGPAAFTLDTVATAYTGSIVSAGPAATSTDLLSGSSTTGFGGGPGRGFVAGTPPGGGAFAPGGTTGVPSGAVPSGSGGSGGFGGDTSTDTALADYLVANQGTATWIVAVSGAQEAAQLELQTGLPVMAMGGWSGSDNALTLDQLKADIADGSLRYVIVAGQGGGPGGQRTQGGSSDVSAWIAANGTAVSVPGSSVTLYDLSNTLGS